MCKHDNLSLVGWSIRRGSLSWAFFGPVVCNITQPYAYGYTFTTLLKNTWGLVFPWIRGCVLGVKRLLCTLLWWCGDEYMLSAFRFLKGCLVRWSAVAARHSDCKDSLQFILEGRACCPRYECCIHVWPFLTHLLERVQTQLCLIQQAQAYSLFQPAPLRGRHHSCTGRKMKLFVL